MTKFYRFREKLGSFQIRYTLSADSLILRRTSYRSQGTFVSAAAVVGAVAAVADVSDVSIVTS